MLRFGKKGKLSHHFVGPCEIFQRFYKAAYELRLRSEISSFHPVFDVSMLKKCIGDPESILPIEGLDVDENLSYGKVLMEILDR